MSNREDYLADPNVSKKFWSIVFGIFALLVIGEFIFGHAGGHGGLMDMFGFNAVFGFAAGFGTIALSKVFKKFFKRGDDYYDDE